MEETIYDEINSPSVRKDYYLGWRNKLVRIYWYLKLGLDLLNDFKYLVAGILALAVILKVDNNLWILVTFAICVPVLIVVGYIYAKFGARTLEYLNLKLATHFSQYNIKLQEKQLKLLEELIIEIRNLNTQRISGEIRELRNDNSTYEDS